MNLDLQNIDKCDLSEEHSNFRAFGIGKESEAQKTRRAKIKKALHDASVNISNTSNDALKSTKDEANKISKAIGDKLGGGIAVHAVNKFNPLFVTMRGSVLAILNVNLVDLAHAFYLIKTSKNQKYWNDLLQKWWMMGGDKSHFDKSVEKGKNKKPLLKEFTELFMKKKHGFDGFSNADGKGANTAGAIVSTAGSLTGVVGGAALVFPDLGISKAVAGWMVAGGGGLAAMGGTIRSFAKDNGATQQQADAIPITPTPIIVPSAQAPTQTSAAIVPFNPDTTPTLPSDPIILDKVADEMNAMTKAQQSGKDHTLVSVHTDPAVDDKILGMPRTAVYIGIGVIVLIGGFLIARRVIKNNS